jgi:hypothetical protein
MTLFILPRSTFATDLITHDATIRPARNRDFDPKAGAVVTSAAQYQRDAIIHNALLTVAMAAEAMPESARSAELNAALAVVRDGFQ